MSPTPPMAAPKRIKRYSNRKLYDPDESRYITLDEVAALVRDGVDLQIVDNKTGEDLTSVTLAQIILDSERDGGRLPLALFRRLIQDRGAVVSEFLHDNVGARVGQLRDEAEQRVSDAARAVWSGPQRAVEGWRREVEGRVRDTVGVVTGVVPLQREIARLQARVEQLEHELHGLRGSDRSAGVDAPQTAGIQNPARHPG